MSPDLKAFDDEGCLQVIIESPRGSTLKYEYRPEKGIFTVSRTLPAGMAYPFDWGFIPGTKADDGDPIDALVIHDAITHPGVLLPCRILGVVMIAEMEKGKRVENPRIIALPKWNNGLADTKDVKGLPKKMRQELEQFFLNATLFTGKKVELEGWRGRKFGKDYVTRSMG
jgi:inorganic pyrophosphatase